MRIIGGKFRRRKLHVNPGMTTRPITDRAKEMLFQYIGDDIIDKRVADIFCGTGSLGIEALSRGATGTVFFENDAKAYELLRKNIDKIDVDEEYFCWRTDAFRSSFRPKNLEHLTPFDVVFFDPPYRHAKEMRPGSVLYLALQRLARENVTSEDVRMYFRMAREDDCQAPPCWELEDEYRISSMKILIFKKAVDSTSGEST